MVGGRCVQQDLLLHIGTPAACPRPRPRPRLRSWLCLCLCNMKNQKLNCHLILISDYDQSIRPILGQTRLSDKRGAWGIRTTSGGVLRATAKPQKEKKKDMQRLVSVYDSLGEAPDSKTGTGTGTGTRKRGRERAIGLNRVGGNQSGLDPQRGMRTPTLDPCWWNGES